MPQDSALQYRASCLDPAGRDLPGSSKKGEYVLYSRRGSVAGLRVEHRVLHAEGPATFRVLKAFPAELASDVQEVLILGGVGADRRDGTRLITFTGDQHWLLNNQGEVLRVVTASGTVLESVTVPAHTCHVLPAVPAIVRPPLVAAAAFGPVD